MYSPQIVRILNETIVFLVVRDIMFLYSANKRETKERNIQETTDKRDTR